MKFRALLLALVLTIYIACLCAPQISAESDGTAIRVGCFDMGNYYAEDENGNVNGYDSDYLEKISQYTGLRFQFVDCGTWTNAMVMLENKEIDLLGTMQSTPARQERYAIGTAKYGITYATLAALSDSGFVFEDYERITASRIGCTKNYVRLNELKVFLEENGISPELVLYDNIPELEKALESGEIDLVAENSHSLKHGWMIVERYCYAPYFFASWKGNERLIQIIDEALLSIELYESDFRDNLMKKYFASLSSTPFTKEELDYIALQQEIPLYFSKDNSPLAFYDDDRDKMQGILIDLCELVSARTGLKLVCLPSDADETAGESVTRGYSVVGSMSGEHGDGIYTAPLYENRYYLYEDISIPHRISASYSVAVRSNSRDIIEYFNAYYPEYDIVECETTAECIDLIRKGLTDLALLDYQSANEYMSVNSITNIINIPTVTAEFFAMLELRGADRAMVASIINKGISDIPASEVHEIAMDYTFRTKPRVTLSSLIQTNPLGMAVIFMVLFAATLAFSVWISRYNIMKKEKQLLTKANEALERANKAKSEFFSRMSHDMRTPMNAIIGLASLAKDETHNPAALDDYLEKIEMSGGFLLGLINDILDMTKIESEALKLKPEPYTIEEFMRQINVMTESLCLKKNILFRFRPFIEERCVRLDKLRFNQIFFNLLSNAIKFTPDGGKIEFTITQLPKQNNKVRIIFVVSDTGMGMSESFQEHLFEPYMQEDSDMTYPMGGSGLGLAIVKNLVTLMDGVISVKSEPGKGSEFTVELEAEVCEEPVENDAETEQDEAEMLNGKNILLCEDNELNTQIAITLLKKIGLNIDTAENGKLGTEIFAASAEGYYDAILMDIRMPEMDGLVATETIRCMPRGDALKIPIIAMTANAYVSDVEKSLAAGMNAHLAKPIEPVLLFRKLTQLIRERLENDNRQQN